MSLEAPSSLVLLQALAELFPDSSRNTLKKWILAGRVAVDGEVITRPQQPVGKGQDITLQKKLPFRKPLGFEILYEDRWIVVIDKPTGLLSFPSDDPEETHALRILQEAYQKVPIYPVHRIDRDTSGVLCFAKGAEAQEKIKELFEAHALQRIYLGIVEGHLIPNQGTWTHYLVEKENFDVVVSRDESVGKKAITHFEVYRRSKQFTFLKLTLETGKKHQIRVQCKEAGHPIVGDKRYDAETNPIRRLGLHAHYLSFVHPFTNEFVEFTSPLPHPFKKLGFWQSDEK